jgi:hypothetical protein
MTGFTSQIASLVPNVFPAAVADACSSFTYCDGCTRIRCTSCTTIACVSRSCTNWYCYVDGGCCITV